MDALSKLVDSLETGKIPEGTIVTSRGGKHKRVAQIDAALRGMDGLIRGASIGSDEEFLTPNEYTQATESLADYEETVQLAGRALGMLARGGSKKEQSISRFPTRVTYRTVAKFNRVWPKNRTHRRGRKAGNRHGLTRLPHDAKIQELRELLRDAKKPADRAHNRWQKENQKAYTDLNEKFDRAEKPLKSATSVAERLEGERGGVLGSLGVYELLRKGLTEFSGKDTWVNDAARELDVRPEVDLVVREIQVLEKDARSDLNSAGTQLGYADTALKERDATFLTRGNVRDLDSRRTGLGKLLSNFGASVHYASGRVSLPEGTMFEDGITQSTPEKEELFRIIGALPTLDSTAAQVATYERQLATVVEGLEQGRFNLPTGMSGDLYGNIERALELLPADGFDRLVEHYEPKLNVQNVEGAEGLVKTTYETVCRDLSRRAGAFNKRTVFHEAGLHGDLESVRSLSSTIREARGFSIANVVNSRGVVTEPTYEKLQALEQSLREAQGYSEGLRDAERSIMDRSFKSHPELVGPYAGQIEVPEIADAEKGMQSSYVSACKGIANEANALSQTVVLNEDQLYSTLREVEESIGRLRAAQAFEVEGVVTARPDLVEASLGRLTEYERVLDDAKGTYEDMKASASPSDRASSLASEFDYYMGSAIREARGWGINDDDTICSVRSAKEYHELLVEELGNQSQNVDLAEQPARGDYDPRVASILNSGGGAPELKDVVAAGNLSRYESEFLPALVRYDAQRSERRTSYWDSY